MSQKRHSILVFSYFMTFLQLRFQAENAMLLQRPAPILALILCGWVGREGRGPMIGWLRIKRSLQSHVGGGGAVQDVEEHNLHQLDQQTLTFC
jgi:hypothetical protein